MNDPSTVERWTKRLLETIRLASTSLPDDVLEALSRARAADADHPQAASALDLLLANCRLARKNGVPLCQDTGTATFFWRVSDGCGERALRRAASAAVAEATRRGWLRRNTIDTLSGKSIDTNVAPNAPVCHFEPGEEGDDAVEVTLLLKGGGSENMGRQYSLPDAGLGAGRDLDGARKCLLHATWSAQGKGCAPGILGVCIGGDRAEGWLHAKRQLLRRLDDASPDPRLAELERRTLDEANSLGIGPMGTGGTTTLLGVKATALARLPASCFVTVAYNCWACRRATIRATADGRDLPETRR
ncbi:MAG: fumarate hydratase [Kiritimatiellia bacterium]